MVDPAGSVSGPSAMCQWAALELAICGYPCIPVTASKL